MCRKVGNGGVKAERQRVIVQYSGKVQGVGFRYTARELARGFDVCGTVRNCTDGSVELIAEGARGELEAFRLALRDSGLGPCIRNETVQWTEPRGDLRGFQILR
ncbi:MAG: acylphosphatase [Verrucomicrobiae bacterium]|nr:acylphosphatase [Verrucomicrobiae bacterium]